MGFLTQSQVAERFRKDGTNSSHFVWLLSDALRFYECSGGWIFGFVQRGEVTIIALEPLIPGAPLEYTGEHLEAFRKAWDEFAQAAQVRTAAFVAVYEPFARLIRPAGFEPVRIGHEPWMLLSDCIPRGNAGKGVRSARNQAIHQGLRVEEWKGADIGKDPVKKSEIESIFRHWISKRLLNLSGFLNATDPFREMESRRYFILKSSRRIEGLLVASPVPGRESFFLEDLMLRPDAPRGGGEFVTLEAMVALRDSGAKHASLGVVAGTTMEVDPGVKIPESIRFLISTLPKTIQKFYNFQGLEMYRKRFKPHLWGNIYLSVKPHKGASPVREWLKVFAGILLAHKPELHLTWDWFFHLLAKPFRKYPITTFFAAVTTALFATVNHWGSLPDWALAKYGFFGSAPLSEWLYRSVISDFLYFNPSHFFVWGILLFGLVNWAERTHRRTHLFLFLALVSMFDDWINYWVVIRPFQFYQPELFNHLIAEKDVGGSLILMTLIGLQLCQFRYLREPLFALITLGMVLSYTFTARQMNFFVMNLDHVLFLVIGFLAGKIEFEYRRYESKLASKGKPPAAKSVFKTEEPPAQKAA